MHNLDKQKTVPRRKPSAADRIGKNSVINTNMTTNNYVTFVCSKYPIITRDNGYCKQEDVFGNYLWDELDKRGDFLKEGFFLDYGFEMIFKIHRYKFYGLLTVVDDDKRKFAISTSSTLDQIEKIFRLRDEKEHSYLNQLIDDILRLDGSISEITWTTLAKSDLNKYEGSQNDRDQ